MEMYQHNMIPTEMDFPSMGDFSPPDMADLTQLAQAFQGLSPIMQIVVIIVLAIVTTATITFIYYIVKVVFTFIWKMVKGIVKVIGAAAKPLPATASVGTMNVNPQTSVPIQAQPTVVTNSVVVPPIQPMTAPSSNATISIPEGFTYHCSECGNAFTEKMMNVLRRDHKTFCEFCGQGFEIDQ